MILIPFTLIGLAYFAFRVDLLPRWRKLKAEFDRDFGTCDKIFPPYKHEPDSVSPDFKKILKP